jgi:tetratricopeptide (TPR) repeat protein
MPASRGDRPAVFLIPGFGASTLTSGNELVWPAAMAMATIGRLAFTPGAAALTAERFVGDAFDTLHTRLEATHDVVRFPYDWRVPLEVEAARLAQRLEEAFAAGNPHPVRLLTHGSGALLARVLQLEHPKVWDRLLTHPDGRIVMLAPPNEGTWMPMQVLSGDDTFGGLLTTGAPFGEPAVRAAFGTMPGLMQLQAQLVDDRLRLADVETWKRFAAADAEYERDKQSWHRLDEQRQQTRWGTPSETALAMAVALRRRLDDAARRLAPEQARKIAIVVGSGAPTTDGLPDDVLRGPAANNRTPFVYVDTTRGDGRVAVGRTPLPGATTYAVEADHESLPSLDAAIPAYIELLNTGTTKNLPAVAALEDVRTTSRASRKNPPEVPGNPRDILSSRRRPSERSAAERRAIRISVVHGDLMFVAEPLVIGHYRSTRLTGTEWVMDRLVGGAMSRSLAIDVYPDRPSSYQIFKNTHVLGDDKLRIPRPAAVVVVGLGEEGSLTAADLVLTVRKGIIAWAERVAEQKEAPPTFDIAATLIGSGGKGMDVAQVAPLIAEAVSDADALLQTVELPRVGEFKIVELFLDRATDAWHALTDQAKHAPHLYQVAPTITEGSRGLRSVPGTHYRGADYDFVSIVSRESEQGSELAYTVDGRRARTDVAHLVPQMPLLLQLLDASNAHPAPPDLSRTLFNLLVPIELEPFLGNATDMVLELDDGTSGIPWEMLDTNSGNRGQETAPWAIRSKIVRKLRVDLAGPERTTATAEDYVLVIGEPRCDPDLYLRLPGARREAAAVADRFEKSQGRSVVRAIAVDEDDVPGPDSAAVLSALYQHSYRIIHIAGHGEPTITGTREGGVVLSPYGPEKRETYLSPKEFRSIRTVPELVFVNCCHVGARERLQLLASDDKLRHRYNRPRFAATLAQELIAIGVRCVIVAGWAVDDEAAKTFALTFYDEILGGRRFIDATAKARAKTRAMGGTTWAAFQCWGDPEWRYQAQTSDAQGSGQGEAPRGQRADAASPEALIVTLETIATRAEVDLLDDPRTQRTNDKTYVTTLEHQFVDTWGRIGSVAYAFGKAWVALGDRKRAAHWYERAVNANDGTAPFRAAEQLANVRVRLAWDRVSNIDGPLSDEARTRLAEAIDEIEEEIESLQRLMKLRPTLELGSLLGSAFKRLAMVAAKAGNGKAERHACAEMRDAYDGAVKSGAKDSLDLFYPAWNRLVADAVTMAGRSRGRLDAKRVAGYRRLLARKREQDEDFWSAVAEFELAMIQAVAASTLGTAAGSLAQGFRGLAERVPATWMWGSVHQNSTFVLEVYRRRLNERAGKPTQQVGTELAAIDALLSVLGELAGKKGKDAG